MALPSRRTSRVREEFNERQDVCGARRVAGSRGRRRQRTGACGRFRLEEIPGQDRHLPRQQQPRVAGAADLQGRFREAHRHDAQGRWLPGAADAPAAGHRHECAQRRGRRVHDAAVARRRAVRRRRLVCRSVGHVEERRGKGLRSRRPEPGAAQGRDVQRQADQHAHEHRGSRSSITAPTSSRNAASRSRRPSRMSKPRQKRSRPATAPSRRSSRAG